MVGQSQALEGLTRSEHQFNVSADRIARLPLALAGAGDTVDLSADAVAMLEARNSFEAITKIVKTGDRMDQALLDTIG
ncbi:MAG: hypothetical protein LAP38_21300 [Acidobacteriia bacterium]|nr:hypothetical protein [Terriglobia bacterium]